MSISKIECSIINIQLTRLKKKISSKIIYSTSSREIQSDIKLLRETTKSMTPVPADINLYSERAAFWTYKGDESIGIIIESKEIVAALRLLFEKAWINKK